MSHEATTWAIRQRGLPPAAKLVLWHLCDRYHPDHGCFPSQGTLADDCELSRSTLNTHLALLEERGLIHREARLDPRTKRQASTRYRFPFEEDFPAAAEAEKPCPKSGHGSDEEAQSRVRNSGRAVSGWSDTEPVIITRNKSPLKPPLAGPDSERPVADSASTASGAEVGGSREQGDAVSPPVAAADDIRREGERGAVEAAQAPGTADAAARSIAARKAHETKLLNDLVRQWPSGLTERRKRIDAAWEGLSAQEKRDAARRGPVYLRRVAQAGRKPGTLARYLADAPWRVLPDPTEQPARMVGRTDRQNLREDVAWKFLEHADARELLAQAVADELVPYLVDEVRKRHELPTLDDYSQMRGVWVESRAAFQRSVDTSGQTAMAPTLRRVAEERAVRHEAAAMRARAILGLARDGPPAREVRNQAGGQRALRGA
jgi:DNA-binding transcriptional ArsR family regulator